MKKIYNIIMLMTLAAFTFASCDDPNYINGNAEEGQLKMSTLGIDVDASENIVTLSLIHI